MDKILVSFSGGRTSAYMTKWIIDNWSSTHEIMVVFANTGKEREETLMFVDQCDKKFGFNVVWVEAATDPRPRMGVRAKVVNYTTASRNGEPFEAMIAKHGIPNVRNANCTRELKGYTIRSYARSVGWKKKDYQTAIGIRIDEVDRVSKDFKKERLIYPLVSNIPTDKSFINKFWSEQSFDLELKTYEGNCDLCFKKSFRKLMTLVNEKPNKTIWWQKMEDKYGMFVPDGKKHNKNIKPPINFFRQNKSIQDIVDMAKNDFEPAVDESQYIANYETEQLWGLRLDGGDGCGDSESCEVY